MAHSNPLMDEYTIFGIIIVIVIGFFIWLIYKYFKDKMIRKKKSNGKII